MDENILICLHCEHRTLHLCSVQIGVYCEKTGYTAVEKEIVRPAALANEGACKNPIPLYYCAYRGCIALTHAQIEDTA